MLESFFDPSVRGRARVRSLRNSPHGVLLDSFSRELFHLRYANITARRHIRSAEHFIHVSSAVRIPVLQWGSHALAGFSRHLSRRRCSYGHNEPENQLTGAGLFLRHLRASGLISSPLVDPAGEPALLSAFRRFMHEQRGTCDRTLGNYEKPIRELLKALGEDPRRFNAQGLRQCFLKYCAGRGPVAIKHGATALRMFLRFLIADGQCPPGLEAAIPLLPHWRLASLPRYLQPEEVERIVASCDLATSVGKRDRAILLLLARLGLRAGDVVQLRLSDLDWKNAWVQVCGKGRRQARLPLTQEVGDALVDYLQRGRPPTDDDRVFVCSRAPFRSFTSYSAVSATVGRAMRRTEVDRPGRGAAHLLRHSVATSLLRHGASLQDIATLLRHRSIQTTQIYAKVDFAALRQIAQPWPEVRSC
jgi:integrase/recombinase XerD